MYNIRWEKILEKSPFWEKRISHGVLIPFSSFREAGEEFYPEEKSYFVGYTLKENPCFLIITVPALPPVSEVHHRMPYIIASQERERFFAGELPPYGEVALISSQRKFL